MTKKKTIASKAVEAEAQSTVTGNALFQEATLNQSSNNILSKEEANALLKEIQKLKIDNKQAELDLDRLTQELSTARADHYTTIQNVQHYTGSFWQRLAHLFQGYGSALYSYYHSVD